MADARTDDVPTGDMPTGDVPAAASVHETVGDVAGLYLGNILYAIERAAVSLDAEDRREDAAFYRGIGRKLAEARGRERAAP